jgi:thiosulfate dehydrogenase
MLRSRVAFLIAAAGTAAVVTGLAILPRALNAQQSAAARQPAAHHPAPAAKNGNVVVMLCDGKTSMEIKGLKPGQRMSHEQAAGIARKLMATWQREHPGQSWEMAQAEPSEQRPPGNQQGNPPPPEQNLPSAPAKPANAESPVPAGQTSHPASEQVQGVPIAKPATSQQQGDTYASFHERDFRVWQYETQKFVEEGKRIFHSDKLLGGTIGVSCDMCHPDAANTHPETYPKYQVQLQRVALLRDMIEWCIENPVKGKTMDPNDERLRALEAYILAQRKGVPLDYGKH